MKERITDLSGIELGIGPRDLYYLFVKSETLQESTMIPLQASYVDHPHRKVLEAWIKEQLDRQETG